MYMAKENLLTKSQFSLVGAYTRLCGPERRFSLQQNLMIVYHMTLVAAVYFHLYNICGFTSSV